MRISLIVKTLEGIIMSFKPISYKHKDKYVKIGWNIAYYRKAKGMSQLDLAEKANISRGFISSIEASNMSVGMSFETFFDIADALEIEAHKLLEFRE